MTMITKILTTTLICTTTLFALSNKELAITIDLSGKQRMLTQKMTKEIFLIKLNMDKKKNTTKLTQTIQLFDKTLQGLIKGDKALQLVATKDTKIQEQLKKVVSIWEPFHAKIKNILKNRTDNKAYLTIEEKSDTLLHEMNRAVELYTLQEEESGFLLAHDMNLAGKQRMLLEKMSKSLLIANHGIEVKKHQDDFLLSQKLFIKTLHGLSVGEPSLQLKGTNLPKINQQLKVVKQLWLTEQKKLQTAFEGEETQIAINALEGLSIEMDKSVKLYTASLNRQQQKDEFSSLIKIHTSLEEMDQKTKSLIEKLAQTEVE